MRITTYVKQAVFFLQRTIMLMTINMDYYSAGACHVLIVLRNLGLKKFCSGLELKSSWPEESKHH